MSKTKTSTTHFVFYILTWDSAILPVPLTSTSDVLAMPADKGAVTLSMTKQDNPSYHFLLTAYIVRQQAQEVAAHSAVKDVEIQTIASFKWSEKNRWIRR